MQKAGSGRAANEALKIGSVVIGRNEGERLVACLKSQSILPVAYVDSGSTDDSVANACKAGVSVIQLSTPPNFSAARARNAGMHALLSAEPDLEFIQMTDGDCVLRDGWIERAVAALRADPGLAAVFGRRRELHPERSVYNALCDDEWNVPVGEVPACGGDALFRVAALQSVGGYNDAMIAGEDPDLSMRLRRKGWRLERIDAEMTWHDAAILHFSQFWNRTRRSGHAYAELAQRYPDERWPNWTRSCQSILFWGGVMPVALIATVLLAIFLDPLWWIAAAAVFLPWPAKIAQLYVRQRRHGLSPKIALASGAFLMIGKLPQFLGLASFYYGRWRKRSASLIEYKGPRSA